jgi:hypothetical protein
MVGACVRGTFASGDGPADIAERYAIEPEAVPFAIELRPDRVTSWRGFAVTTAVPRAARELRIAQA